MDRGKNINELDTSHLWPRAAILAFREKRLQMWLNWKINKKENRNGCNYFHMIAGYIIIRFLALNALHLPLLYPLESILTPLPHGRHHPYRRKASVVVPIFPLWLLPPDAPGDLSLHVTLSFTASWFSLVSPSWNPKVVHSRLQCYRKGLHFIPNFILKNCTISWARGAGNGDSLAGVFFVALIKCSNFF